MAKSTSRGVQAPEDDEQPRKKSSVPKTNMERVRQVAESMGGDGGEWLKLKAGKNRVRLLPSRTEDGSFFYSSLLHFGFSDGTERRAYPCMRALGESKCPVCQVIAVHQDDTNPDVRNAVKNLSPKKRFIMNVIDRAEEGGGVKLLSAGPMIMKDILAIFRDPDFEDITDPEEGRDITIDKEGSGMNTEYAARPGAKQSSVGMKDWHKHLFDLKESAYRDIPTRKEYLQYLMDSYGDQLDISTIFKTELRAKKREEEDAEDGEEEDDSPKSKSTKKVKRKTLIEKDEEEDEEELDDASDEEEDDD